mgnify:CR=1 FL=1
MRDPGGACLVDQTAGDEALQLKGLGQVVISPGGQYVREQPSAGGYGLEPSGSPPAIDEDPIHGSCSDDGTRIVHDIDDAGPLAQQRQSAERWKQLEHAGNRSLRARKAASLRARSPTWSAISLG